MKQCPQCGNLTTLGRMYCPKCGYKLDFIEDEVTQRAAAERKAERISELQDQLIQWIALMFLVLVIAWCFKDYALRRPDADTPAFFYGPAVVGAGEIADTIVIGKGDLEIARSALQVPAVETVKPVEISEGERTGEASEIKKAASEGPVTVPLKDGRSIHGNLLGQTRACVAIAKGDQLIILPREQVESIQRAAP